MPLLEREICKLTDNPTCTMINIWHDICDYALRRRIEVVAESRRKHPKLRYSQHEINTAFPAGYKGKVVLSVWVESFPALKPIVMSHEVGHWVLNLRGFRGMLHCPRHSDTEVLLNSLASHPPLYRLQREAGHDPQAEIDSSCDQNSRLFSQPGRINEVTGALRLADDILNCSFKNRERLEWTLGRNHPNTLRLVNRIVALASDYNLLDPEENIAFRKKLIEEMNLGDTWRDSDNIEAIRKLIQKVEGTTSR